MSGNNEHEQFDLSGLTQLQRDNFPLLERQLKTIIGVMQSGLYKDVTPALRERVKVLKDIQREHDGLEAKFFEEKAALEAKFFEEKAALEEKTKSEHDELEAKFFEERTALEAKYQTLYAPLYSKRYDIVTGAVEVDGAKEEGASDKTDDTEKGVPDFWLTAMKNNEITKEEITERDEEALKYLENIKWCRMDDPKGFKLEFFFETNPFFTNSVLSKVYHMIDDVEPILEKAIGTTIEWQPGKCLTQKILMMKPIELCLTPKKAKPIIKTKDCESFFNFFSPPEVPDDAVEVDEDAAEELKNRKEQDYDVGSTIRDKIIPHAVSWFTGEAKEFDEDEQETKMRNLMMMIRMQQEEHERARECKQQ